MKSRDGGNKKQKVSKEFKKWMPLGLKRFFLVMLKLSGSTFQIFEPPLTFHTCLQLYATEYLILRNFHVICLL